MSHRSYWTIEKIKMKEKVIIISSQKEFALVKVDQNEFCQKCSARFLCLGGKHNKGTITVLNPLSAQPGDEVNIEIPEGSYSKELIYLFGVLLMSAFSGLFLGYFSTFIFPWPSTQSSFIGFLLGLLSGGLILFCCFRQTKKNKLYPVIINIIKKGDFHG